MTDGNQTMDKKIEDFIGAGCELATPFRIFFAIFQATNGKPCDGCAYDSHGSRCEARRRLFTPKAAALNPKAPVETVREAAARLGISISEVRRRRREAS